MIYSAKLFCISLITMSGFIIRFIAKDFLSEDMKAFLLPWFYDIQSNGGLDGLYQQVGDYGLLYQTIISLFTYLDKNPIYLYKALSISFDFFLALTIAFFISEEKREMHSGNIDKSKVFCYSYAIVLMLPTVFLNSAFWGQCDSIYTSFLLWSVWFLYKRTYSLSFFMLGIAFAFKLQSILLVPLFLFVYHYNRQIHKQNFSLFCFFITFLTFWFSGIVAYCYGRGILDGIIIYVYQSMEYRRMWMNLPSVYYFWDLDYNAFHLYAILLTFLILVFGLYLIISGKKRLEALQNFIEIAVFIEWTCMLFLPAMHERYTYVMDIMLVILAISDRKYIKYALIANALSFYTYSYVLFSGKAINCWCVMLYIISWLYYSYSLLSDSLKVKGSKKHDGGIYNSLKQVQG